MKWIEYVYSVAIKTIIPSEFCLYYYYSYRCHTHSIYFFPFFELISFLFLKKVYSITMFSINNNTTTKTYDQLTEKYAILIRDLIETNYQNVRFVSCNQRTTELRYPKKEDNDFWKKLPVIIDASATNEALDEYFKSKHAIMELNNSRLGIVVGDNELEEDYTVVNFHQSAPFGVIDGTTDLLHKVVLPPFDYSGERVTELDVCVDNFIQLYDGDENNLPADRPWDMKWGRIAQPPKTMFAPLESVPSLSTENMYSIVVVAWNYAYQKQSPDKNIYYMLNHSSVPTHQLSFLMREWQRIIPC